jgi:hypothetical protein
MASGPARAQDEILQPDSAQKQDQTVQNQDADVPILQDDASQETETVKEEPQQPAQEAVKEKPQRPAQEMEAQKEKPKEAPREAEVPKAKPKKAEPRKEEARQGDEPKQELLDRIEELEKRINELTEESRARRKLEITEQEKQEKEKDVLEAVGREYSLDAKRTLSLDYTLSYNYSPAERFTSQLQVDKEADHTIRHIISTTYGVLDNLSTSTTIPFVYRYNKVGTDQEIDESDIGDLSAGVSFQPWKSKAGEVNKTFSLSVTLPTGRSPYEVNTDTELSTGNGVWSVSMGGSFSQQIDPVVAFWNASYTYNFDAKNINHTVAEGYVLEKVETGNSWDVGAGLAYAMSYKVSVNTSISYSYTYSSDYFYKDAESTLKSGDSVSATLGFGMGWKLNNKTTLSFSLGYGLTSTGFSASVRVPFTFLL